MWSSSENVNTFAQKKGRKMNRKATPLSEINYLEFFKSSGVWSPRTLMLCIILLLWLGMLHDIDLLPGMLFGWVWPNQTPFKSRAYSQVSSKWELVYVPGYLKVEEPACQGVWSWPWLTASKVTWASVLQLQKNLILVPMNTEVSFSSPLPDGSPDQQTLDISLGGTTWSASIVWNF